MANVQRETVKGIQLIPVEDHFFSERKIFMVGEIDSELCYRVVQQLLYFEASDNRKEVTIYINSPGGEVQAGLAVYDVMRLMKSPIKVCCTGLCASMGAIIYLGGDADKRFMLPHAKIMIHDPAFGGSHDIAYKKPHEIRSELDDLNKCRERLAMIIAESTGKTLEEIYKVTEKDSYFDVNEAIEFGLACAEVSDIDAII